MSELEFGLNQFLLSSFTLPMLGSIQPATYQAEVMSHLPCKTVFNVVFLIFLLEDLSLFVTTKL